MKEQFVSFNTAKLAKEKGINFKDIFPFNYTCYLLTGQKRNSDAYKPSEKVQENIPTQSLLQKWLREKYKIHIVVDTFDEKDHWGYDIFKIQPFEDVDLGGYDYTTFEDALDIGLQEALKLI